MAEDNGGEMTVPVVVGKKVDVTKQAKHSKKSVLYVNKKGHFHMMPEDMALNNEKNNRGHIIDKTHKDYMKGFKAAIGVDDKIGTAKFVQSFGKVSSIEDVARFDATELVRKEQLASDLAKKEAERK